MTSPSLSLVGAISQKLAREHQSPVLTNYQLAVYLFELYRDKEYDNQRIRIAKQCPGTEDLSRIKDALIRNGIIQAQLEIGSGVYRYLARPNFESEEIICGVDPFAYISHLSAMVHHGLTDRLPKIIFATTLDSAHWAEAARRQMEKQLGSSLLDYLASPMPALRRIKLKAVNKQQVSLYTSSSAGSFIYARERSYRVSSIGRTFLDMLRRPDLCNGMGHVLSVYEENAKRYLRLIVDEISQHGTKIECVRAGYILEEVCRIQDPRIDAWTVHAQRGGSRRLDPTREYESEFSERWCISLNAIR